MSMTHDIEEFDMQRAHAKIYGVVSSAADAQQIATQIGAHRCVDAEKIAKISKVVNSERQKYVLEFDTKCPEDAGAKKKKPTTAEQKP
jgi:general secretion pathway protein L